MEAEGDGVNYVAKWTAIPASGAVVYGKVTLSPLRSTKMQQRIPRGAPCQKMKDAERHAQIMSS